jgi:hypothetical protein
MQTIDLKGQAWGILAAYRTGRGTMVSDCCCSFWCDFEREGSVRAQRMVTDAIVSAVRDVVTQLKAGERTRAKSHVDGLIELLDNVPSATAQLFKAGRLAGLAVDLQLASEKIAKGDDALNTLHRILLGWFEPEPGGFMA